MQSRSAEGRILATLARPFARESQPALILRDLLDDGPSTEEGEARFVADAHSVIFTIVAGIASLLAIGTMAAADSIWGHAVARRTGAILMAPSAFFISIAVLVQIAKFRGKCDGVQPVLGKISWMTCGVVVLAVSLYFCIG